MSWHEWFLSKTVWSGVGLIGLAVWQASQGQYDAAFQSFSAGLAALGIRHAIAKSQKGE